MKKNNVETKKIFDISSLNSNFTQDLPVDSLLVKDIWYAEEDLGLRINQHQRNKTINFGKIQQSWLKKRIKQYIIYRRIQGSRNGNWEIEFINWKFKEQLDRLPINDDLVALVKQQQEYITSNLGNNFNYLFSANIRSFRSKEEGLFKVRPVAKVMALNSFNRYLQKLAEHCQIKDKSRQLWHFTSHQFRRTVATKMTNEQVRQYIIQCYLRHKSPDMLQHYAQLLPDTMKEEMKEFRKKKKVVDITGREVEQIHSELDNDIGLQWLRAKMQPKALAMGFCARPALLKPCPHANACMTCEHFRLDEDDLPALKQHKMRNEQLKQESQKLGLTRQIKSIEQDEARLNELINSLSNGYEQ